MSVAWKLGRILSSWPNLTEIGPTSGKHRSTSGRNWSIPGKNRSTPINLSPTTVDIGPNLADASRVCPACPKLGQVRERWPVPGEMWSTLGRIRNRSRSVQISSMSVGFARRVRSRAAFGHIRAKAGAISAEVGQRASRPGFGPSPGTMTNQCSKVPEESLATTLGATSTLSSSDKSAWRHETHLAQGHTGPPGCSSLEGQMLGVRKFLQILRPQKWRNFAQTYEISRPPIGMSCPRAKDLGRL